ncbi:XdhC family protein [Microvirga brassicacearum]|uniref:XdhC family protein n=1 Tax=Microvirga brassicacearum TaxID=2580413 RepID=A0A5N3P7J4_9HYPH|nr:XdhC family protein [Microvirga brassicacearum]KAB0265693.1 XdhC family protein [Microvirga brassicacearum]
MVQNAPALRVDGLSDSADGAPVDAVAATSLQVLRFVADADRRSQRVVLVTITDLTGSSSRPAGTLMAVAEDGGFAGSFSGGCIEAAVITEAQEAIRDGLPRQVRYGAGSPYLDIKLPCGGGVDLLFQPEPHADEIRRAVSMLEERVALTLVQRASGGLRALPGSPRQPTGWQRGTFISWHAPPLRLLVIGHGVESLALVRLGLAYGAAITLLSPDERVLALAEQLGAHANLLTTPGVMPDVKADPWSAIVLLFHDHAWEPLLLEQALAQPAFFIGAMGSRRTHANRLEKLREHGVPEQALARIAAPLGLIPSARDPVTLALSALAQVVDGYRRVTAIGQEPENRP